jgi:antitoxin YefM
MNAITYSEARANLADTIKRVCRDRNPVIITRKREDTVVMMSLADYESLNETAYLLRNPRNAQRLLDAVQQLDAGKGTEHALIS